MERLAREADRIVESTDITGVQHFIVALWWRRTHWYIGIAATVLATVATALAFADFPGWISGTLGVVVAVLTGLLTFLTPRENAEKHHTKGVEYHSIRDKIRREIKLHSQTEVDDSQLRERICSLGDEKLSIDRKLPAAPGGKFYDWAKVSVEKGETSFRADVDAAV